MSKAPKRSKKIAGLLSQSQALQRKMKTVVRTELAAKKKTALRKAATGTSLVVGAYDVKRAISIMKNPSASEEDIRSLPSRYIVQHPNCPPHLWWMIADKDSATAKSSPAWSRYAQEDPERWSKAERLTEDFGTELGARKARLFAADCAMHVLHIFEKYYPADDGPRRAIDAARKFADDRISASELDAAYNVASTSEYKLSHDKFYKSVRYAAGAASSACLRNASQAYHWASLQASNATDNSNDELQWQRMRKKEYAQGAPMYSRIGRKASTKSKK